MTSAFRIRPLAGADDFLACVALQRLTWGADFEDAVPPTILWVAQRLGGIAGGAFDEAGRLAGFIFGLTGPTDQGIVHWSDMLAVRPELRDSGLGFRLKCWQRERLLEHGVRRAQWTFDPLESRNAWFNFARLGITAAEYRRDLYAHSNSVLHNGLPTDRLIADWALDSERVSTRIAARAEAARAEAAAEAAQPAEAAPGAPTELACSAPLVNATRTAAAGLASDEPRLDLEDAAIRIAIPRDIQAIRRADRELALDWRMKTRAAFESYLGRGYRVVEAGREGERSVYLLTR